MESQWSIEGLETKFATLPKNIYTEPKSIITESEFDIAINYNLSNEEYHSKKEFISASNLREAKTPFHYKLLQDAVREPSKAMDLGTAFHTMFLEPEKFEYFMFDDTDKVIELQSEFTNPRASKKYKEWKESVLLKNTSNAPVVSKEDFKLLWSAHKRIKADEFIKTLSKDALKEVSIFATNEQLKLKVRPDIVARVTETNKETFRSAGIDCEIGDAIIGSLKTTRSAHPDHYRKDVVKMEYHISEAFYHDVLQKVFFEHKIHIVFIASEPATGLYMVYTLQEDFIHFGRQEYSKRLNLLLESIKTKNFDKGYETLNNGSNIMPLYAPSWANIEIDLN